MRITGFIFLNLLILQPLFAQAPIELGEVKWLRDIKEATQQAKQSGKPILILFQEIPGCITCQRYGSDVLSHPLIVEAIEQEFIPLAIHNNKNGEDSRVLKFFGEPAWNNPVVRIVDADLKNIVQRLDGNYTPWGVSDKMIQALTAKKKIIPGYLRLTAEYLSPNPSKQLSFSMSCFWEGEKNLGHLEGVIRTEPGFIQGQEVVKVNYDPSIIGTDQLIKAAKKQDCAKSIFVEEQDFAEVQRINKDSKKSSGFKPDRDPQYYLKHSAYRYVPMLAIQASRLNSALARGNDPTNILSPRQMEVYKFYESNNSKGDNETYHNADIKKAWKRCTEQMKRV